MKFDNQQTIKIIGEKRLRVCAFSMITLLFGFSFFMSFFIHFEEADNLVLYYLLFSIYGIALAANIYLLFRTERKIVLGQLIVGASFIVLALTLFVAFLFVLLGNRYLTIFIASAVFLLLLAVMRWVLIKINYHNFKKTSKMGTSFLFCMIGAGVGRGISQCIRAVCGKTVELSMMIICLVVVSVLLGFMGVFSVNRYVLAKKYEFSRLIEYIE